MEAVREFLVVSAEHLGLVHHAAVFQVALSKFLQKIFEVLEDGLDFLGEVSGREVLGRRDLLHGQLEQHPEDEAVLDIEHKLETSGLHDQRLDEFLVWQPADVLGLEAVRKQFLQLRRELVEWVLDRFVVTDVDIALLLAVWGSSSEEFSLLERKVEWNVWKSALHKELSVVVLRLHLNEGLLLGVIGKQRADGPRLNGDAGFDLDASCQDTAVLDFAVFIDDDPVLDDGVGDLRVVKDFDV